MADQPVVAALSGKFGTFPTAIPAAADRASRLPFGPGTELPSPPIAENFIRRQISTNIYGTVTKNTQVRGVKFRLWLEQKPAPATPVSRVFPIRQAFSTETENNQANPATITISQGAMTTRFVTLTIPAGQTASPPVDLEPEWPPIPGYPGSNSTVITSVSTLTPTLLPIDLATDLNNDGQITSADSALREAATKSGASDTDKKKGTEYMFINDKMSNGVWDVDDEGGAVIFIWCRGLGWPWLRIWTNAQAADHAQRRR